jgi:glutamyl-tRNA synthetase
MNAEYIRTMPLADLLPLVKTELKSAKLWREEYDEEGAALTATIPSTDAQAFESKTEIADRPEAIALDLPELGSRDWYIKTVDLIRARFFTLKDFSGQGRAYFSEDYDFDLAAVEKNLKKFPDLQQWMPELADRFEAQFGDGVETQAGVPAAAPESGGPSASPRIFNEPNVETVIKAFAEEKSTKLGVIMNGARTLLTGVAVGPSMLSVFEILGLERTLMRLRSKVAWNS